MNVNSQQSQDNLENLLFNSLNEQGYIFQEACKNELSRISTSWQVRATEYPVSIMGQDTKIDIVLEHQDSFALIECKRADSAYTSWLFGALEPQKRSYSVCQVLYLECLLSSSNKNKIITSTIKERSFDVPTYIAKSTLEVKGDSIRAGLKPHNQINIGLSRRNSNPQNIENAFSQILRGTSGLAFEQKAQRLKSNETFSIFFLPIVITTASLYLAHYKVQDIDLSTGKIEKDKVSFGQNGESLEQQKWVLVEYGASDSIAPSVIPDSYVGTDPRELLKYKMRSIFIVNSTHLEEFFKNLSSL